MALDAAHFTEPAGELAPHLFPLTDADREAGTTEGAKLAGLLATWIAEGTTRAAALPAGTTRDAAVEDWAYHRAKRSIYLRLSSAPSRVEAEGESGFSYTQAQISTFGAEAARHLADFNAAVARVVPVARRRRDIGTIAVNAQPNYARR